MFDSMNYNGGGQYVFVAGAMGNDSVSPNGVTYSFNPKPGTAYVVPARGQTLKQATAAARSVLRAEYGDEIDQLKFQPNWCC